MTTKTPQTIRLTTAPNPAIAHIWEQALLEEGIMCRVVGEYLDAGIGDIPGILPEIWIHPEDLDKATAILEHRYHRPTEKSWEREFPG